MTPKHRANNIAVWFFQVDDPQQRECEAMITKAIEEACAEAVREAVNKQGFDYVQLESDTRTFWFMKGWNAAREKAKGIAEKGLSCGCPDPSCAGIGIAERIAVMEPGEK